MESITFTAIIICEFLNVRTTVRKWHNTMTICILVSLVTYILSVYFLKELMDMSFVIDKTDWLDLL